MMDSSVSWSENQEYCPPCVSVWRWLASLMKFRNRLRFSVVVPKMYCRKTKSTQGWELKRSVRWTIWQIERKQTRMDYTGHCTCQSGSGAWLFDKGTGEHRRIFSVSAKVFVCAHAGCTVDNFLHRIPAISIVYYRISLHIGTFWNQPWGKGQLCVHKCA